MSTATRRRADEYEKHINYLIRYPAKIETEWYQAQGIFKFCTKDGYAKRGDPWGCPIIVHASEGHCQDPSIEDRMKADGRLHNSIRGFIRAFDAAVTLDDQMALCEPYAEWQRIMDKGFRKQP